MRYANQSHHWNGQTRAFRVALQHVILIALGVTIVCGSGINKSGLIDSINDSNNISTTDTINSVDSADTADAADTANTANTADTVNNVNTVNTMGQSNLKRSSFVSAPKEVSSLVQAFQSYSTDASIKQLLEHSTGEVGIDSDEAVFGIYFACSFGRTDLFKQLLEAKGDCNITDKDGFSLLHIASQKGFEDIVALLLKADASINALTSKHQCTPLYLACQNQRTNIVLLLLSKKADCELRGRLGLTPLELVCAAGFEKIAMMLVHSKASINTREQRHNETPLHIAARTGQINCVRFLISCKADIEAVDDLGLTPLSRACAQGQTNIVRELFANGASIYGGKSYAPVHVACMKGNLEIVKLLFPNKKDFKLLSSTGNTPLQCACIAKRADVVEYFLSADPDLIHIKNQDGISPVASAFNSHPNLPPVDEKFASIFLQPRLYMLMSTEDKKIVQDYFLFQEHMYKAGRLNLAATLLEIFDLFLPTLQPYLDKHCFGRKQLLQLEFFKGLGIYWGTSELTTQDMDKQFWQVICIIFDRAPQLDAEVFKEFCRKW